MHARVKRPFEQQHWIRKETVLHCLVSHHDSAELVRLLLEHKADPASPLGRDPGHCLLPLLTRPALASLLRQLAVDGAKHSCVQYACLFGNMCSFDAMVESDARYATLLEVASSRKGKQKIMMTTVRTHRRGSSPE